ncbi:relaxase/mobilization nuclease domain-containing protein [Methylobacterium tarhaniae]|uniref:relaxase/mobilization nuclease domain-containing protein n=1 Tax=Methylobacterium tarhaniae TaxID=1187852 RepID=UPI003D05CCD4
MVPNIERGYSFKGVTAYLTHDKRDGRDPHPASAERVGFIRLFNFVGDEARNAAEAATVMALTARDAAALKAAAGIRPGGRKVEKGPVWHASLSWAPGETPSTEEMIDAAAGMLETVGLSLDRGHQTFFVEHTDTDHRHVHVVVNLVHPINGKQANPYRDLPKAQAWAHGYDKSRGHVFCPDRASRYERRPSHVSDRMEVFQAAAAPQPVDPAPVMRPPPRAPRPRAKTRPEWLARRQAGNDNGMGEGAAAALRRDLNARYARLYARQAENARRRHMERERFFAELQAGRDEIVRRYADAFEAVRKGKGASTVPGPQRAAWVRRAATLSARRAAFVANEATMSGRLRNAAQLGEGLSAFRRVRLALNKAERQLLFEQLLRTLPPHADAAESDCAGRAEAKRVQSDRLRARRDAELAFYARSMARERIVMADRHQTELLIEDAQRAELGRQATELWRSFGDQNQPRWCESVTAEGVETFQASSRARFLQKSMK